MATIVFFETEPWESEYLKRHFPKHKVITFSTPLKNSMVSKIKNADVLSPFIYSQLPKNSIQSFPSLKFIATRSTGFDHIDVAQAKKQKVNVSNVPTYGENTVAEHTFALILGLARKLYPSIKQTHEHHLFETDHTLRGFDLKGKALGIIGYGHIGKHVARMANGFEMNVLVNTHHKDKKHKGITYASLPTLLKKSDVVSLHVPLTPQTKHLIDAKALSQMKNTAILINTSRGGLIDTHALVKALQKGTIAAAGLDVLEGECHVREEKALLTDDFKATCDVRTLLEDHLLMKMDNVIVTPHNAFNSKEALLRILDTTIENIQAFLKKRPKNLV